MQFLPRLNSISLNELLEAEQMLRVPIAFCMRILIIVSYNSDLSHIPTKI